MNDHCPISPVIVFLDIDGVLQPCSSQDRFNHNMDALQERLAVEVDAGYLKLDKYDIAAVQYDWHGQAIHNLKALCDRCKARIVISSAWRHRKTLAMLKLLFRIHHLDHLIVDVTPELGSRDIEIQEFLVSHPEIERFVIVDDAYRDDFERRFPRAFVKTDHHFDDQALRKALAVLRQRPGSKKKNSLLDSFDALARRDPQLTSVKFDIADVSIIRRCRDYSAHQFLQVLCEAVALCPKLGSLTIRGIRYDFTWQDRKACDPVALLKSAAEKNPCIKHLDLEDDDPKVVAKRKLPFFDL